MELTKVEILTIGDEILYGQITDTNATWLSKKLTDAGYKVNWRTTVGDNKEDILSAFNLAEQRADIILITGGLGPTADDLTKPLITEYFNTKLVRDEIVLAHLHQLFSKRGREITLLNEKQADVPEGCRVVPNPKGTAPGLWLERNGKVFIAMPGVPYEMKHMVTETVLTWLFIKYPPQTIYHRIIKTSGLPESLLANTIKDWEATLPDYIKLAYLPHLGMVDLRLTALGDNLENLKHEVKLLEARLLPLIKKNVYGYDDDTLVAAVGKQLTKKGYTISTAESCTAGYVAHQLTSQPGSSTYFCGGIVAYQDYIKQKILNVSTSTLENYGAVSEKTVLVMATSIKEKFNTEVSIAISGVAGPGGGTELKPVGLVWVALSTPNTTFAKKINLTQDRILNIQLSTTAALTLLLQTLTEND